MPKRLDIRYDTVTGEVRSTVFTNAGTIPEQPVEPGTAIKSYDLEALSSQEEVEAVLEVKRTIQDCTVMGDGVKRHERYYPDALLASSGLAPVPTLANFQEFGTLATAARHDQATLCHVTMPTPTRAPVRMGTVQTIVAMVGQSDPVLGGIPTVRIEVWEAGGARALATSPEIDVTMATQRVVWAWDANILSHLDGHAVELKLRGTAAGPPAVNTVQLGPVFWQCLRETGVPER